MNQRTGSRIDATRPHAARIWDFWLGGRDHYPVDREVGERILELHPGISDVARAGRAFLGRAVRHLAADAGVRQFLDIGTGLPTADNTHQVAQRVAPDARVVYVDNDPLVLVHARARLVGTREGVTDYALADLRDPEAILEYAARTLDFTRPVGLLLIGVVIFIGEDEDPYGLVRRLMDALPSGSFLALSHTVTGPGLDDVDAAAAFWNERGTPRVTLRTPAGVARFFDGLELLPPGVVPCSRWQPEETPDGGPAEVGLYAGVGRKP
ncbi:MAG: hypothetical protein QOF84_4799 [Streptomyces sp.]|nr:hypothetical protein [Streptomyces sp.]MDX6350009.1 hypothetical protein [Streptomyces sp.]